jgi:hypothetical protein
MSATKRGRGAEHFRLYRSAGFDNNILRDRRRRTRMSSRRISIPGQCVEIDWVTIRTTPLDPRIADTPLTRNRNPGVCLT